jgi:anaerobic selenocysteine-containing dehydrogenase
LLQGIAKCLIERHQVDSVFIAQHTEGFADYADTLSFEPPRLFRRQVAVGQAASARPSRC